VRKNLTYLFIIFSFLFINHCTQQKVSEREADIALYADKGADEDCIKATQNMFQWMGYTVALVNAYFINNGGLGNFRMLCVPGGDMYQYAQHISSKGKEHIKNFIIGGGGYIGICGGAFFAGEKVIWQGSELPMTPLGIFPGTTKGPINEIILYPDYGMCKVNIVDLTHFITESESDSAWILYYWGPELIPNNDAALNILGRYDIGDQPVMVALEYGAGRVFLIGTHPEFEEDSDRDGVTFAEKFDDKGTDWELMKKAALWCLKK
jgi:biotin--protein ligase